MNKKRKIIAAILTLAMLFGLAACGGSSSSSSNTPAAEGSVYWLNFKPELDATAQALAEKYTKLTGIPVRVLTAASGSYYDTLMEEMNRIDSPTMFVLNNREAVEKYGKLAADLKGTKIEKELNTSAYNLYDADGRLAAVGYCYECYGIIVNPDLIEAAGHSMDEINDFAGLTAVAEDIHKRESELGFDAFTACDMDSSSSWRFTGHMANLEYVYEEREAGAVWKKCPSSLSGNYMDNYKKLYDLCINNSVVDPDSLAVGGHNALSEFKNKEAAFYVNGSWEYDTIAQDVPNAVMIPYYCGVEGEEMAGLNCGTENYWAVSASASEVDQKATLDFMVWLVSDPEASAEMVRELGVLPYKNAPASANGFLNDAEEYTAKGCYVFDWATNWQPNQEVYRAGLVEALTRYNSDQSAANWEKVRAAFVDGWAEQYKEVYGN